MNLNVYTVSFSGILIVRDADGNETSRRVAAAPRDVTVASNTQNEAVDYAKRTLPDGLEINVQHVVQVANAVEIVGAAAAGEDLVVENEQLTAALAELNQSSGLAVFQLNEQVKAVQEELALTQQAFAAFQKKIAESAPATELPVGNMAAGQAEPSAQPVEKLNDPANPNSEVVIDDQPPHKSITVGELKQREGQAEPPLDQQLATVEIPSEFDKPIGETPAQGNESAAS